MKLVDLLILIADSSHVLVEDEDGNELGYYDGRDSIPESLNEREVINIAPCIYKWGSDIPCIVVTIGDSVKEYKAP